VDDEVERAIGVGSACMSTRGNSANSRSGSCARNADTPPASLISSTESRRAAPVRTNSANVPVAPAWRSSAVASAMQRSVLRTAGSAGPAGG